MRFRHDNHDIFIPDETPAEEALKRVTHLGIVSHQDDLEIAAYHGITASTAATAGSAAWW